MAGQEFGFRREAHHFPDGFNQVALIGIGEVDSADSPANDQVAADQDAFFRKVEHDVTGGMAWRVNDFDFEVSDGQLLPIIDDLIRLARRNDERKWKHGGFGIAEFRHVEAMHEDFGIGESIGDFKMVGNMVEMAMSQPEPNEVVISAFGLFKKRLDGVVRRIKENGLPRLIVSDEVAVGGSETAVLS